MGNLWNFMNSHDIDSDTTSRLVRKLNEMTELDSYIESVALDDKVSIQAAEEVSRSLGQDVSPEMLGQAMEQVKRDRHRFEAPKSFSYGLAKTYASRSKIWRTIRLPILGLATLTAIVYGGVTAAKKLSLSRRESQVEQLVAGQYESQRAIPAEIEKILNSPFIDDLTQKERTDLNGKVQSARSELSKADEFLSKYAPEGNPKEAVTKGNMDFVANQSSIIGQEINTASGYLLEARKHIEKARSLAQSKNTLESLVPGLSSSTAPATLIEKARREYNSGIRAINERNESDAIKNTAAFKGTMLAIDETEKLIIEAERDYSRIEKTVREDSVRNAIANVYQTFRKNSELGRIEDVRKEAEEISYVARVLPLDLNVKVVGGTWMCPVEYETENGGCRPTPEDAKTWYLNVHAVDGSGKVVPLRIFSSRNGNVRETDIWGERVEKNQYQEVGRDKTSDGVVDNDKFGRKRSGYLTIERESVYPNKGQINKVYKK